MNHAPAFCRLLDEICNQIVRTGNLKLQLVPRSPGDCINNFFPVCGTLPKFWSEKEILFGSSKFTIELDTRKIGDTPCAYPLPRWRASIVRLPLVLSCAAFAPR